MTTRLRSQLDGPFIIRWTQPLRNLTVFCRFESGGREPAALVPPGPCIAAQRPRVPAENGGMHQGGGPWHI